MASCTQVHTCITAGVIYANRRDTVRTRDRKKTSEVEGNQRALRKSVFSLPKRERQSRAVTA